MRYRVIVQRETGPGRWKREWSIAGPAEDPTEALAKALSKARHPAGKRAQDALNYRSDGDIRYPNIEVRLSGVDGNVFNVIGRVRQALKTAGVPPAEVTAFTTAVGGRESGLQKITWDYDRVLQVVMKWVSVS